MNMSLLSKGNKKRDLVREEMRELEIYIRDFQRFLPLPVCHINSLKIIVDVNESFERLSGYKSTEIIGEDLEKLFADPREIEKIEKEISEKGEIFDREVNFLTKEKKEIPVTISAMTRKDKEDDIVGFFLSIADITELKRAEETLVREHSLLKNLMGNIPESIYFKDRNNRFIMVSKTKAEHVGSAPEDIIGKTDFDFYPKELAEKMAEDDKHVMETGESIVDKVERLIRPSGEERWVSVTKAPLRDENGVIVGTMGISRDITERRSAENKLRESEQRYRALFENALDGVFVIDAETMRVVLANEAAANMFGFDHVEEAIGLNPIDFIHPEDRERAMRIIVEDMFVRDLRQVNEFRTITRDGREIWIRAVGARIKYQGRLAGLISLCDITEQKKAQEALERERTLLRTVIDLLPDAVYAKDLECRKILASRADLRAMGVKTEAEALGKTDFDVYPKELAAKFYAIDQAVIKTGQPIFGREEVIAVEGQPRWFLSSKVPLRDSAGQVIGLVGVGLDITDYKKAEKKRTSAEKTAAKLRAIDRMKDEFLSMTSHELKTPLTPVRSFLQLMKSGNLGKITRKQREALAIISTEIERLGGSIDKLLQISRLESKKIKLKMRNLQLADIIQNTVKKVEPAAKQKRIALTQKIAKLPMIRADGELLAEVLNNLVDNAIKFTPEGGRVTVEAKRERGNILVMVTDTGIGIAKKDMPKLFTKFFQVDHSVPGTGLGLSICKKIVLEHGGRIWAKSRLGGGSTFFFTLPVKK